jgi:hypothetical protein
MTPRLYKLTEMWRFEGWSYYFFDDPAMMRLLHEDFEDFPHMKLLTDRCIEYGTTKDTGKFNAALQTGPHALYYGFRMFMEDAGVAIEKPSLKPVKAGLYAGTDNRTCRDIGHGGRLQSNNHVIRESISQGNKSNDYKSINMTHNQEDKNQPNFQSCISSILHGRPKR